MPSAGSHGRGHVGAAASRSSAAGSWLWSIVGCAGRVVGRSVSCEWPSSVAAGSAVAADAARRRPPAVGVGVGVAVRRDRRRPVGRVRRRMAVHLGAARHHGRDRQRGGDDAGHQQAHRSSDLPADQQRRQCGAGGDRGQQRAGGVGELRCLADLEPVDPRDAGDAVVTHPATAAMLTAAVASAAARLGRASASRPAPSCSTAVTTKMRASCGCSAWTPVAAAWIAPAPIDMRPPLPVRADDATSGVANGHAGRTPSSNAPGSTAIVIVVPRCPLRATGIGDAVPTAGGVSVRAVALTSSSATGKISQDRPRSGCHVDSQSQVAGGRGATTAKAAGSELRRAALAQRGDALAVLGACAIASSSSRCASAIDAPTSWRSRSS